jgi:hypothetical protein
MEENEPSQTLTQYSIYGLILLLLLLTAHCTTKSPEANTATVALPPSQYIQSLLFTPSQKVPVSLKFFLFLLWLGMVSPQMVLLDIRWLTEKDDFLQSVIYYPLNASYPSQPFCNYCARKRKQIVRRICGQIKKKFSDYT